MAQIMLSFISYMKAYSFQRGGISYDDPTAPQNNKSDAAYLPTVSVISLFQHPVGNVIPLVSVGAAVHEGMLVGKGTKPGSSNIHSSVPGKIIRNIEWNDCNGIVNKALVVRMEGAFKHLGKKNENFLTGNFNYNDLIKILSECGIVEMEQSGTPITEKLELLNASGKPHALVVRCIFDDPWLAADYVLLKERLKEVVEGCFIIAKSCKKIERVIFAVSKKEKFTGLLMLREAEQYNFPVSMILTGSKYPQRNRRELEIVLKNFAKNEKLALGSLLILGPATLAAVHDAVKYHRPVLERYVALGGPALKNPCVMRARIGKKINDLINECGGVIGAPERIIAGSPLSGKRLIYPDEPITKTTYAVYAMLKAKKDSNFKQDCISCGECRNVCPVALDPEELYKQLMILGQANSSGYNECHGCGCCELVCPSRLPLAETITGITRGQNA